MKCLPFLFTFKLQVSHKITDEEHISKKIFFYPTLADGVLVCLSSLAAYLLVNSAFTSALVTLLGFSMSGTDTSSTCILLGGQMMVLATPDTRPCTGRWSWS